MKIIKKCCICGGDKHKNLYSFNYKEFKTLNKQKKSKFCLVKCKECGFIFNTPRFEYKDIYEKNYYVFNSKTENNYNNEAKKDLEIIMSVSKPLDKILEIGCARGHLLSLLKEKGYDVQGIEISEYASNIAKNKGLNIFNGTIENFNKNNSKLFDIIVALDVLEHVESPAAFLLSIKKCLKKNGTLILETPNTNSIFARLSKKSWIGFNPFHINLFSPKTIEILFNDLGFNIKNITTKNNDFFSISGLKRLGLSKFLGSSKLKNSLIKLFDIKTSTKNNSVKNNSQKKQGYLEKYIAKNKLGDQILIFAKIK